MSVFEKLFKFVTFSLVLLAVYEIFFVAMYLPELHRHKPASCTDLPRFTEIWWIPIVSAFCLHFLKRWIVSAAKPFLRKYSKDQGDKEAVEARVARSSQVVFKLIYYICVSLWAYILFKDSEVLPPWLGGKGSLENHFVNFPYAP